MIQKVFLPQNLLLNAGTVQEAFEVPGDWTTVTCAVAAEAVIKTQGTNSLKVTPSAGVSYVTKTVAWDLTTVRYNITLDINIAAGAVGTAGVMLFLASDAGVTNYYVAVITPAQVAANPWKVGWNTVHLRSEDFTTTGTPSWNSIVRMRVRVDDAGLNIYYLDNCVMGRQNMPAVAFCNDDPVDTSYTLAKPILDMYRVLGTTFATSGLVGTAGYMTWAQLQAQYALGWTIGNHASTHTNFTTLTQAEIETKLTDAKTAIQVTNSMPGGAHLVAYPAGGYDADSDAAMTAQAMTIGRTIVAKLARLPLTDDPRYKAFRLPVYTLDNALTLAQAKAIVDNAITNQAIAIFLYHGLHATTTSAVLWRTADFLALVDYVILRRVQPITFLQMETLLTSSLGAYEPDYSQVREVPPVSISYGRPRKLSVMR